MKKIKNVIMLLLLLVSSASLHAQLVEGTPCTAACLDPNKSAIIGRMPNQNGTSPNLNIPCGSGTSEDNPAWWVMRPSGTTLTFAYSTSNCIAGGCAIGIQVTLWEGDACGSLTHVDCSVGISGVLTATVTPCKLYYLQVDGLCESQCDVIITYDNNQILKEVSKPEIKGPKQICKGATAKFCASLPTLQGCRPDSYNWTLNPASAGTITKITGSPDCVTIKITNPPADGKVGVCAEPKFNGKCPPKTNKECFEFEVIELKTATCKVDLCPEELPFVYDLKGCINTTNPNFTGIVSPQNYIVNLPAGTKKVQNIAYSLDSSGCSGLVTLDITIKKTGDSTCACGVGNAGKMNLKFLLIANNINKTITAKHQNGTQTLGSNDIGGFVLHEGNGNKIVNPIAVNKTGTFSFDSTKMKCNRMYFISYVVGKKVNNLPDLKDKCLSVVPKPQGVSWLCKKKVIGAAAAREAEQNTMQDTDYQVNIYPNPTEDNFFIEIPSVKNATLDLYNTQGQIVLSQKDMIALSENQYEAPVAHLPKGVYVLKMNLDGKTEIRKVIIE